MTTFLPGVRGRYAPSACKNCKTSKRRCKDIEEEGCAHCRRKKITCEWDQAALSKREAAPSPSPTSSSNSSLALDELGRLVTFQLVTSYLDFPFPYNIFLSAYGDFPRVFQEARGCTSEISPVYELLATTFLCSETSSSTHRAVVGSLSSSFSVDKPDFATSFGLTAQLRAAAYRASVDPNPTAMVDLVVAGLTREPVVTFYQDRLFEQWQAAEKKIRKLPENTQLIIQDAVGSALASSAQHRGQLRGLRSHLTRTAFRFLGDSRTGVTLETVRALAYVELSIYAEGDLISSLTREQLDILWGEHLNVPSVRPWNSHDLDIIFDPRSFDPREYNHLSKEVEEERLGSFYLLGRAYRRDNLEGAIPTIWAYVAASFEELDGRVSALMGDPRFDTSLSSDPINGPSVLPESSLFIHAFLSTDQNALECLAVCHRRLVKKQPRDHGLIRLSAQQIASTLVVLAERIRVLLLFTFPPKLLRSIVKSFAETILILEDVLPPDLLQAQFATLQLEHQHACFQALYLASFFSPLLARLAGRLRIKLLHPGLDNAMEQILLLPRWNHRSPASATSSSDTNSPEAIDYERAGTLLQLASAPGAAEFGVSRMAVACVHGALQELTAMCC